MDSIDPLVLDLVDWIADEERAFSDVISLLGTPTRQRAWDEAIRRGLVSTEDANEHSVVRPTSLGLILGELRRELSKQNQREAAAKTAAADWALSVG